MGLFDIFRRSAGWTPPPDSDDYWYQSVGVASSAGVEVNDSTAPTYSGFFACERVICEDVSSLPLVVYERTGDKARRRALEDHRYSLLHDQPNELMTAMGFRDTLTRHAVRQGNGYAWIEYEGRTGRIKALWPLRADRMTFARTESGRYVYRYQFGTGTVDYLPEEILHIAGPGFDGLRGYSIVSLARDSIGLGLAAEQFGARMFANNARPGMVLEHPGPAAMSDTAYERLKTSWSDRHQGVENAHKVAILEEGMKVHEVGFPPEDIQFLETREHQLREMCRWFRMQPHKVGDLKDATFSNIEMQSIEHVTDTIRPWCVRWEQAILLRMFGPQERKKLFAEHIMEGLLRGDITSRYAAYAVGKQWGFLSTNDIRDKENMNPVDGGDEYLVPLNMIPATMVGAIPKGGEPAPKRSEARSASEQAGEGRRRISEAHRPLFEAAFQRQMSRERSDILKGAKTHLTTRDNDDFVRWAYEYFDRATERMGNELWGLYATFAEVIQREAALEIGAAAGLTPEMDVFMREYVDAYVKRHIGMSMASILDAIGKPDGDPLDLLTVDLNQWDKRPEIDARWEAHRAANAVARETWKANGVTHIRWQTHGDNCPYCSQLNGKIVGIEQAFATKGEHLQDPDNPENWMSFSTDHYHPPVHGGCLPGNSHVAAEGITAVSKRWHDGNVITISTARGHQLTCTPNHPILTSAGWVAAGILDKGGDVISSVFSEGHVVGALDHQDMPPLIEEVADAFRRAPEVVATPVPVSPEDFHGDGINSQVAVVFAHSELMHGFKASCIEHLSESPLQVGDEESPLLSGSRREALLLEGLFAAGSGDVGGGRLSAPLGRAHSTGPSKPSLPVTSDRHIVSEQSAADSGAAYAERVRQSVLRLAGQVAPDQIVDIKFDVFHGWVYNLDSELDFFVADSIVTHNCDCTVSAA